MTGTMIELTSTAALLDAMASAKEIALEAYTLHGPVLRAAEEAAQRGAHVVVRLAGQPYADRERRLAGENARLVGQLRAAGAQAELQVGLHSKDIVVDGTLYLDGKNWHGDDLVLRDNDATGGELAATKYDALEDEERLLRTARATDGVIVESESFGCCNGVYSALRALGQSGAGPRLLVSERELRGNQRERRALNELERDGVRVRVCRDSEKLAVSGGSAWLGSANATVAFGKWNMIDWGATTSNSAITGAVRARLESAWRGAKNFKPASTT